MYQPLLELPPASPLTFVTGERLLGEAGGVLHGESRCGPFQRLGGAVYAPWRTANGNVVARQTNDGLSVGPTMEFFRRHFANVLHRFVCTAASFVPPIRLLLPTAVTTASSSSSTSSFSTSSFSSSSSSDGVMRDGLITLLPHRRGPSRSAALLPRHALPERVVAAAFHPHCPMLAVAIREGAASGRVVVYDVSAERETAVLTHAFLRRIGCVAWKPFSRDVLAVGCEGGALVWSLSFGRPPSPHALFYRFAPRVAVTALAFSPRDGRYVAMGSRAHVEVAFHDARLPPASAALQRSVSLDGGTAGLLFAEDDSFAARLVAGAAGLILIAFPSGAATRVPTSAPVLQLERAAGLGPNHFVMRLDRMEGVVVAHMNPFVGVQVVALVSTGICGGVGGRVRRLACSGRRLYMALETGHLLLCHYGRCGTFTLIPIGVAEMDATHLAVFDGFTRGSLLAAVEADQSVTFVPSYHA